ncbi:restriction endonuclease subunit S [Bifidobacterium longum]|uniref:restriction endonuclease subunit S n=1 Tax=Bifidobacterium longum TaxID=216816 RepID=UPI002FDBAC9C
MGCKLHELVSLVRGNTYKSKLLGNNGPALLGLGTITRNGGFNNSKLRYYPGETSEKILMHPGDLYVSLKDITNKGDLLGAVARVPDTVPLGRLTQDTVALRFHQGVSTDYQQYVYWSLRTPQYRSYCKARGMGTTNLSLSRDDFLSWELPNYSYERKTLVELFEEIEKLISNLVQANGHLLDMLMIGYRQLVASIGSYGYIEDLGTVIGGATPSKKRTDFFTSAGISWITPRDLSNSPNVFIAHGATDITDEGYRSCSTKLMPAGSVLFSSRAPVGYVAISSKEVCTNQGFKSVVPFDDIGMAFVFCFLKDNAKEIEKTGSGTTFTEVSGKAMKNFSAPIPSDKQAQQFGSYAEPLLAAIQNNENEIMRLEQIRDTLLPKLMSGEIDVSKVELPTPPEQAQTSTNGRLPY